MIRLPRNSWSTIAACACNLALTYVAYMVCRIQFVLQNWDIFGSTLWHNSWADLITGCWMFDTSAILYTCSLYALLMLLPLHYKESSRWQSGARWLFILVNGVAIAMNLADSVYFKYTGRRTTASVTQEFSHEGNISQVMGAEFLQHWYLVVLFILMIVALWRLYVMPVGEQPRRTRAQWVRYYLLQVIALLVYVPLTIAGMRGGFAHSVRPITISNANQYVRRPAEAAVVLNTPFSLIRTVGKTSFVDPGYFTAEKLNELYSPVVTPRADATPQKKNVVVLIVESFGREYIGFYNHQLEGGKYQGYTPFADSLIAQSLTFQYTFANGRKSIDGMPSILSSIPMFVEPFFLTPASMNTVSGLAGQLDQWGYQTAFFHGADRGSMGFLAFSKATGFQHYYGRQDYDQDKRFGGDADFDGMWAIWDEPFLQYYAQRMTEMKQPFMTALFTASSHHPYVVPEAYRDTFPEEGGNVMHKCIRYTDHSLRRFFQTASRQPWYQNTIFVLTSDHTNLSTHAEYETDLGLFSAPIAIFDPSGQLPRGQWPGIAQQIDIMPTLLSALGYDKPYVAFGCDLLHTPASQTWAVNYLNGIYQYVRGDYLLQFDGTRVRAFYNYRQDWMLRHDLHDQNLPQQARMEQQLKALIQSYMQRMINDQLTVR